MSEPAPRPPVEAKAPAAIEHVEWAKRYGWKYRGHILVVLIGAAIISAPLLLGWWSSFVTWAKGGKLIATVVKFDQEKKSVALLLDNRTSNPVVIEEIYFKLWHAGLVGCFKILRGPDRRGAPDDWLVFRVPAFGGFETIEGQPRLNVSLLNGRLTIEAKSQLLTNLVASSDAFHCAADCFLDNSPLDLGIHFSILEESETWHEVHLPLGTYSSEGSHSSLNRGALPWTTNLLPSPKRQWRDCSESALILTGTNWVKMPWKETETDLGKIWRRLSIGSNTVLLAIDHSEPKGTITPHF